MRWPWSLTPTDLTYYGVLGLAFGLLVARLTGHA
jgi:hypothetical protein